MVVETSRWPKSSWMVRMSWPRSSRCVAKERRKVWQVRRLEAWSGWGAPHLSTTRNVSEVLPRLERGRDAGGGGEGVQGLGEDRQGSPPVVREDGEEPRTSQV